MTATDGVAVREARAGDLEAMVALLDVLFSAEPEFVPDRAAQLRGLTQILADPAIGTLLIAERRGAVVGMVNLLYTVSTALGAPAALLEDVVVRAEERGRGVGGALLNAAVETARRRGCARITLHADAGNVAAQRFYRRAGFEASAMLPMRLHLRAERGGDLASVREPAAPG